MSFSLYPLILLSVVSVLSVRSLRAQGLSDAALAKIEFEQRLNTAISQDLAFRDETGQEVRLASYFGRRPVILVLGYYQCPMLCTLVLNGLIEGLQDIKWTAGNQFEVVCVSINPNETPALAAAKKRTYLRRYARHEAESGWHFLTGTRPAIERLSGEVGFHFALDPASKEYAHPSGLVVLTPEGRISSYLLGVTFPGPAVYDALEKASAKQIGSPVQRLVLLCFHYNPITGRYGARIMFAVRLLGAATLLCLVAFIVLLVRRSNRAEVAAQRSSLPQLVQLPKP